MEKPPVPAEEKAWIKASYRGIPASFRQMTSAPVRAQYMEYRILEVWLCLGTSLEKTGPGVSAWVR